MKQIKITAREAQIIATILNQKLNINLGLEFNTKDILPHINELKTRTDILKHINAIKSKDIEQLNIKKEIEQLNIKLNK